MTTTSSLMSTAPSLEVSVAVGLRACVLLMSRSLNLPHWRHCFEHRRSACGPKRPEGGAEFADEELRLLPRCEVAAFVDPVVVDKLVVGTLGPAARGLVDLAGKDRDGCRDG